MNTQPDPSDAPKLHQSLKPRLVLTFGEYLGVSYTTRNSTSSHQRYSIEEGEAVALRAALADLKLHLGQEHPIVECCISRRDLRVMRGMAGGVATNGRVDTQLVEHCAIKARDAASDIPNGWAGTRLCGQIVEIAVDGVTLSKPQLDAPMPGNKLRVEVLEVFYDPEVETARTAMLEASGLAKPTFLHLSPACRADLFST